MKLKFTELQNRFQSFWFFFQNQYFETMTGQLKNHFHNQTRVCRKFFLVLVSGYGNETQNGGNFQCFNISFSRNRYNDLAINSVIFHDIETTGLKTNTVRIMEKWK